MIARHWRGWTRIQDAEAYENLLKNKVLPSLKHVEGYEGGSIFRKDSDEEVECVVVNFFDSLEAVQRFAGPSNRKQSDSCPELSRLRRITGSGSIPLCRSRNACQQNSTPAEPASQKLRRQGEPEFLPRSANTFRCQRLRPPPARSLDNARQFPPRVNL
jgi:hypothetical protein